MLPWPAFLTTWRGEVRERDARTRRAPGGGKRHAHTAFRFFTNHETRITAFFRVLRPSCGETCRLVVSAPSCKALTWKNTRDDSLGGSLFVAGDASGGAGHGGRPRRRIPRRSAVRQSGGRFTELLSASRRIAPSGVASFVRGRVDRLAVHSEDRDLFFPRRGNSRQWTCGRRGRDAARSGAA